VARDHLLEHGTRSHSQAEPMRADQVENSAGGFVWEAGPWTRLRRFLILGTEGGSYYADERSLTRESVDLIRELAETDGPRLVQEIVDVSRSGRAPKNDEALFALAVAISNGNAETRSKAAEALPLVARTGTHLYQFVGYAQTQRGWGSTLRWAVGNWFRALDLDGLALQAVKYRQREGWTLRDVLRKAHPDTDDPNRRAIWEWITHGPPLEVPEGERAFDLIQAYEAAQRCATPEQTAALVAAHRLPREALLTEHLTSPVVWRALLEAGMPTTALIRNLGNMTRLDVLDGEHRALVVEQLSSQEAIRKARVHPFAMLLALRTYASGRGERGRNAWAPIPAVIDALDAGFYLAFENVEPTGKRILLALDISGSMDSSQVRGSSLTAREASAALAMVAVAREPNIDVVTFSCAGDVAGGWIKGDSAKWGSRLRDGIEPFGMSSRQRLDDVIARMSALPMGGTDCALPMLYALERDKAYDAFVIYTDNETWAGDPHPAEALTRYRRATGIGHAKLAVVGMVGNRFTIADPRDAGMLDLVGLDAAGPTLINEFIAGRV
jgi:60 kDa SS-A/Ro ribonucleoprotein